MNSPEAMCLVPCHSGSMLHLNVDGKVAASRKNFSKGSYLQTSLLNLFYE